MACEEKRRKQFVGQRLGVTPKSWLTPKCWLLIWNFEILLILIHIMQHPHLGAQLDAHSCLIIIGSFFNFSGKKWAFQGF